MPLKTRGSVNVRLSVWFSATSARPNAARSASSTSRPPGSSARSAASPRTASSDARRFVPASVISSVPVEKSNAARPILPGGLAPAARHCSRPAIMRWITRNSSSSSAMTIRLPSRRRPTTRRPVSAFSGGSTERRRNGVSRRTRCRVAPAMRRSSASMYTVTSGSSGNAVTAG